MHPMVEEMLPHLPEICRRHFVRRLDLFGSAATDQFDPLHSDMDFLVEFLPQATRPWMGDYQELKADLERLYSRKVDLVIAGEFENPYFRRSVELSRTPLYAA
jgi:hypothetical protein